MWRTFLLALAATTAMAQSTSGIRTYCNPLDVDYKYMFKQINADISFRSGADPVIINHKDEYDLFATMSGGYWHSSDLVHWNWIRPSLWPVEGIVAPAAVSDGERIYLFPSNFEQRPIFVIDDPKSGRVGYFNRWMPPMPNGDIPLRDCDRIGPWDPDIFRDPDTGRWFMYFGSSDTYPIYGIELDFAKRLTYIGKPKALLTLDPEAHGWERFGKDHRDPRKPYIEGAWMTKHAGRYYLQYAAPGTEYNVYANGVAVGDGPLGPFAYAPYNPLSYKPGGFMTGAGHGNTFRDRFGNFWNTGTPWIGINWNFERRMAMFPAGFDEDGQMFSNTRFGDFPHYAPTGTWTDRNALFTGWMLLSYRKPAVASSSLGDFPASNLTDEDPRTFWVAAASDARPSITIDLQHEATVRALQVNFSDYHSGIFESNERVYTQFRVRASRDGRSWQTIADLSGEKRDRPNAYLELAAPLRARYIRYEHLYVASPNVAISDIRVFGNTDGKPPATPTHVDARRDRDRRNAFLSWNKVPGAVGYNVLWGIAPKKLYQTYQVWADSHDSLEIRALNADQPYWFAVEAFNETGVSSPSAARQAP